LTLIFRDELRDHQQTTVQSNMANGDLISASIELPASFDPGIAEAQLRQMHREMVSKRRSISIKAGWSEASLTPGDLVAPFPDRPDVYRITKLSDGVCREIEAEIALTGSRPAVRSVLPDAAPDNLNVAGQPWHVFLDLPRLNENDGTGLRIAAWSRPWLPVVAYSSPATSGYALRASIPEQAMAGTLATALPPGSLGRWDARHPLDVQLFTGALASAGEVLTLGGANAAAVRSATGQWEIVQFAHAQEISPGVWRLSKLLRGQLGTNDAAQIGATAGAEFVLLDTAAVPAGLTATEAELVLNWKVGPAGKDFTERYFATSAAGPAVRAKRSFSPVRLKGRRQQDGSMQVNWIRRGAMESDGWDAADIPLPEGVEAYQIRVLTADGIVKRSLNVASSP
jgi:hypothetical protein